MVRPDYTEFSRLAGEATLIPVVKSVMADLLTPVSAFLAVAANEPDSFLLESVERGEQIGRYTFLGARPYMRIVARGDTVWLQRGKRKQQRKGNVLQVVKELLRQHQPAAVPGLPPFTAGAVGYFAYDMVRQLEKIGEHTKDDLSVPDCVLMFFDRLLAFDQLGPDRLQALSEVPTRFKLPQDQVDMLIVAGRDVVRGNETFQRFQASLSKRSMTRPLAAALR